MEMNVGFTDFKADPFDQLSFTMLEVVTEQQSDKMSSDKKMWTKQRCVIPKTFHFNVIHPIFRNASRAFKETKQCM